MLGPPTRPRLDIASVPSARRIGSATGWAYGDSAWSWAAAMLWAATVRVRTNRADVDAGTSPAGPVTRAAPVLEAPTERAFGDAGRPRDVCGRR